MWGHNETLWYSCAWNNRCIFSGTHGNIEKTLTHCATILSTHWYSQVCLDVRGNAEAGTSVVSKPLVLCLKACACLPKQKLLKLLESLLNKLHSNSVVWFDSDDFRSGCRNVSHHYRQQSFSGLHSPERSNYIITCNPLVQTIYCKLHSDV